MVQETHQALGIKSFVPDFVAMAFQLSLVVTMFGYGLRVTGGDVFWLRRRRRLLVKSLVASFVALPVAAVAIELTFPMEDSMRIALVALSICATPPLIPQQEIRAGGSATFASGLTVVTAAMAFVLTPTLAASLGAFMGRPLTTRTIDIEASVFWLLLVPLGVGVLLAFAAPLFAERLGPHAVRVANVLLAGATLLALFGAWSFVPYLLHAGTLFGVLTFAVAALVVGHFLGGPEPNESLVLATASANRHPGLAFAITAAVVPSATLAGPVLLAMFMGELVSRPYLLWVRRSTVRLAITTSNELVEVDVSNDSAAAD